MAGTLGRAWRRAGSRLLAGSLLVAAAVGSGGCRRSHPQLQRGDAAVVLRTPPVPIPPGLMAVPEREPSDPTQEPPSLPLAGSPGLAVVGALSDEAGLDDEDVYAIEIPGGPPPVDASPGIDAAREVDAAAPSNRALSLEVNPAATLATVLELRDASGGLLGTSSGGAGQKHGLPNVAIRPGGRYLVTVRRDRPRKAAAAPAAPATRPSGSYALLVREVSLGAGDEREPNDSVESATVLGPAHAAPEVAGYFGTPRDRDFYRVPLGEASESTVVSVFLTPPSTITASLAVYDRAGVKVQGARGRPGERVVLRSLAPSAFGPAGPGTDPPSFYLSVQTEGAADLEHRYVLGVRSEPAPDSEREPNDQPIRATAVGPGSWSGYLGPGDVDFFRCEVTAGTELAVDLTPSRRADLVLEVLMPGAGRPQRADAARRGQPERLLLPAAGAGGALLRVQGRRATDSDLEAPYTLTVELRPGGAGTTPSPAPGP